MLSLMKILSDLEYLTIKKKHHLFLQHTTQMELKWTKASSSQRCMITVAMLLCLIFTIIITGITDVFNRNISLAVG